MRLLLLLEILRVVVFNSLYNVACFLHCSCTVHKSKYALLCVYIWVGLSESERMCGCVCRLNVVVVAKSACGCLLLAARK